MRLPALAIIGLIGLTTMSAKVYAFPAGSIGREAGTASYFVAVAQGCGPGFHWVARHRNRYGAWVPGHCAKNIHT